MKMRKDKTTGIILLAGDSTRYGGELNKNFRMLNRRLVMDYSIDAFNENERIDDIILVIRRQDVFEVNDILNDYLLEKPVSIVFGGETRKDSVYNALLRTDSDLVVIHDGDRPLVKSEYIDACLDQMDNYVGSTMAVKATDTIKISNDLDEVINTTDRSHTWLIQTPQCFYKDLLLKMHEKYKDEENITDDCMLLEKDGYKIKLVEGEYSNIKITTKDDLEVAKTYVKKRTN